MRKWKGYKVTGVCVKDVYNVVANKPKISCNFI